MSKKWTATLLPGLCALATLSGCGGSSSGIPVVVEDTPPPVAESLTVSGTVTDMPIPNATVILTVNGVGFQAPIPTDADGNYTVTIESTDPDAMVLCEAFDPNGAARFTAMLNDFGGMQQLATDDAVAGVDITNVTTAQFILASQFDDDGSIDSVDELQDLAEQVDPDQLLQIAAAIKVVVEGIDGVTLPEGFDDVQALAESIVAGDSTFIADIATTNPGALEDAIGLVISDGNATMDFDVASVPGVYVNEEDFSLFALFTDGTGVTANFAEDTVEGLSSWSVSEEGTLEVEFSGGDTDSLTLLGQVGNVLSVVSEPDEPGELPDVSTAIRVGFAGSFDASTLAGSFTDEDEANQFTVFLPGGTGYELDGITGAQTDGFIWSVNESGELEITETSNQDFEVVMMLEGSVDNSFDLLVVEYNPDFTLNDLELVSVHRMDTILDGPVTDQVNAAMVNGKAYALTLADDVALFTFNADGTIIETAQFIEDGAWEFYDDEGFWVINDTGVFSIAWSDGFVEDIAVTSGLGADTMDLSFEEDDGTVGSESLTRVIPFDASTIVGTYELLDPSGAGSTETMTLTAGGGGNYAEGGVIDDDFSWEINSDGQLVNTLGNSGTDVETDTFYLLADSTDDVLHVVFTFRVNGQLNGDNADFPDDPPEAVAEYTLMRQP